MPQSFLATEKLNALLGKHTTNFRGPVARVEVMPASVVEATVRAKDDPKATELPAIVSCKRGDAKVVYLAAGLDAANYLSSYPYYRQVLAGAMRRAASAPPPVEVRAPMCVHAVTMRQKKDGERLVIHLFNDVSTTAGHGHPAEEVPLREEVLPIHDIEIALHGYRVRSVHLEPGAKEVRTTQVGKTARFTVPKLETHLMAVVEL